MALAYGFNVKKAEELCEKLADSYATFGSKVKDSWEDLINVLQAEWIGPDEQDFEKKFADRVCKMYDSAGDLVRNSITNIVELTNSWIKFQNENSVSGEAIGTVKLMSNQHQVIKVPYIVIYKPKTFSDSDDMGLANSNSAKKISSEVKDFATTLKKQAEDIFENVSSGDAFFGDQSKKMNSYIKAVGETLGEITVAVKDLEGALDTLAKSNYKTSDDNIESSLKTATTDIEKLSDELGETRWK